MNLILLTFGSNIKNHYQANFCILSFLCKQEEYSSITVYTDHPDFYKHLAGLITVVPLSPETLQEWKGAKNYLFRIKIKALEHHIMHNSGEPVIYVDSDTFLYHYDLRFKQLLAENTALMHEEEGVLAQQKSKTVRRMWNHVGGKTFAGISITEEQTMWNSGVIGIPAHRNVEAIQLALRICDEMLMAGVTSFMLEQYAVSLALAKIYGIKPADKWIGHYWAAKDTWNTAIADFFLESLLKEHHVEQDIERMRHFDFKELPVCYKMKNTKLRLHKILDKVFPPKEVTYLK
ncbi:hypothetical protein [Pontibacter rugosus]|uniref:Nucleotide-diphospho-sugar transferase n=1 Tax=Pontibacter rugosus TaxID=1745966 RepID=A0ABW3SLQ0_9BACT